MKTKSINLYIQLDIVMISTSTIEKLRETLGIINSHKSYPANDEAFLLRPHMDTKTPMRRQTSKNLETLQFLCEISIYFQAVRGCKYHYCICKNMNRDTYIYIAPKPNFPAPGPFKTGRGRV